MTPEKAAEHLRIIRELMERPIRQTTRSGASAVIAGLLALAGSAATYLLIGPNLKWNIVPSPCFSMWHVLAAYIYAIKLVGVIWWGVLVLAAATDLVITWRRTRKLGQSYWRRAQWQTAQAIAPGFIVGGLLTVFLFNRGGLEYIPFTWMVFYGMAVWSAGLLGIIEVKLLGAAFMAAGLVGLVWFIDYPVAAMAVTFGGFHLIYGVVVWARHGG